MPGKDARRQVALARLAARQHGVITAAQLGAIGVPSQTISEWVRAGRLHRLHRGVYAVGHPRLSFEGRCLAAALACSASTSSDGDRAGLVSHQSAAALWAILPAHSGPIHVTVRAGSGRKRHRRIVLHRSSTLGAADLTRHQGILVTRPSRTLRDLRRTGLHELYLRAARRAVDLRLVERPAPTAEELTRSELERAFLALCRRHRLPLPEVNVRVQGYEVDFLWRERRLVVETDGFGFHRNRAAFEADRARDARLQALGFRVVRFTYRRVTESPREVAAELGALLAGGSRR